MVKKTLHLPDDDVKRTVEVKAGRRRISEVEVIKASLRNFLLPHLPRPRGALFYGKGPWPNASTNS